MFGDSQTETTGFASSWRREKSLTENSSQTSEFQEKEGECQVVLRVDAEVQKDPDPFPGLESSEENIFKVLAFLQKIEPKITAAIEANNRSNAFHGYSLIDEEGEGQVKCQLELRWLEAKKLSVRDVTWNSSGSVVAAAYGVMEHTSWCNHTGAIATWGIHRSDLKPSEPTLVLNVDKCVTSAAFHPTEPALLAGGALNGEVYLWDLNWSEVGSPGVTSGGTVGSHNEAVTTLRWVRATGGLGGSNVPYHKHLLASAGSDGKVLLWKVSPLSQEMKLLTRMLLRNSDIPSGLELEVSSEMEIGVSALAFSPHDPAQFVAGGEGGNVLLCSAISQIPASGINNNGENFNNPMTLVFDSHDGQVSDTRWCPHHPKLFITGGSDGQMRIYTTQDDQTEPSLSLNLEHSVGRIAWSSLSPLIVAAGLSNGQVQIFNLKKAKDKPVATLPNPKTAPVTGLQFNGKDANVIAVGDASGRVRIWRLNRDVLVVRSNDHGFFKEMARETVE